MWRLVIFDCDGVLVDSERLGNSVMAECARAVGMDVDTDEAIRLFKGRKMDDVVRTIEAHLGRPVPASFVSDYRARSNAVFRERLEPVPGVGRVLDSVTVQTCVASNGPHEKMDTTLEVTGLKRRFEGRIFSAFDVPRPKPHPDLFRYAARQLGVPPEACIVVDDSPLGMRAARAAGMRAFGFARECEPEALAREGGTAVRSMHELHVQLAELGVADDP